MTYLSKRLTQFCLIFVLSLIFYFLCNHEMRQSALRNCEFSRNDKTNNKSKESNSNINEKNNELSDSFNVSTAPLIFIGGYARSGTTLMRAILDVHPLIRCGPETKVIPTFINFVSDWKKKNRNLEDDLKNAGVQQSTIDTAIAKFIYHVMENHGKKVPRLCAKDPDNAYHFKYLHSIFPNAKFIYMVRDGRAAAYSYMTQLKEKMDSDTYGNYLFSWNYYNKIFLSQCEEMETKYCKIVKYEDLVLHPQEVIKNVIVFLNESWTDELLNHQNYVGGKIAVSKTEWSTDQIAKPINTKSLTSWVGKIPIYQRTLKDIAEMLNRFDYSFDEKNLNYGENQADFLVKANNALLNKTQKIT